MTKVGDGVFYSPAAGKDAQYHLKELRRWFTLFFIPIFPLNTIGTIVECQETGKRYDPSVLNRSTNDAIRIQLVAATRELCAAVAVADGPPSDVKQRTAVNVIGRYEPDYDVGTFAADCREAPSSALFERLSFLADNLSPTGCEKLLTTAVVVAGSDGAPGPNAQALIASAGQSLTLSPAHVGGIVSSSLAATSDPSPSLPPPPPPQQQP